MKLNALLSFVAIVAALVGCRNAAQVNGNETTSSEEGGPLSRSTETQVTTWPDWMPEEIPIVGWRGIPRDKSTMENYRIMRECGFNINLAFFAEEEQLVEALEAAEAEGMKIIARWPGGFYDEPDIYVPKMDTYPALFGYYVVDEPHVDALPRCRGWIEGVRNAGATKPCYVNLNPLYTLTFYQNQGVGDYAGYLRICSEELDAPFISFDHYPVMEKDGEIVLRPTWFENMRLAREEAFRTGKPLWAFVLSCPHLIYPEPTEEHLRLQINVDLAYGAQGIEYYTYWLPQGDGGNDDFTMRYFNAPVDWDGNPTPTYYKVQKVNAELKEKAKLFYKGTVTNVAEIAQSDEMAKPVFIESLFDEVKILNDAEVGSIATAFKGMKISAPEGAVGSLLTSPAGDRYIVLVNKSLKDDMVVRKCLKKHTVAPGDMLILPR